MFCNNFSTKPKPRLRGFAGENRRTTCDKNRVNIIIVDKFCKKLTYNIGGFNIVKKDYM